MFLLYLNLSIEHAILRSNNIIKVSLKKLNRTTLHTSLVVIRLDLDSLPPRTLEEKDILDPITHWGLGYTILMAHDQILSCRVGEPHYRNYLKIQKNYLRHNTIVPNILYTSHARDHSRSHEGQLLTFQHHFCYKIFNVLTILGFFSYEYHQNIGLQVFHAKHQI
ncbi:hypothetical protein ACJX0J_036813 [Zea mays]